MRVWISSSSLPGSRIGPSLPESNKSRIGLVPRPGEMSGDNRPLRKGQFILRMLRGNKGDALAAYTISHRAGRVETKRLVLIMMAQNEGIAASPCALLKPGPGRRAHRTLGSCPQQLHYGLAGYDFGNAGPNVSRLTILPADEKRMQSWPFTVTFPSGKMSTHLNSATS
jgi:hypothetical protein